MKKINKHIEIARTTNVPFSSMSAKSCEMIQNLLRKRYTHVGVSTVNNIDDLDRLVAKQPDLVFLGLKRLPHIENDSIGDNIWISGYLEENNINFTGSPASAIELDFDKRLAKEVVKKSGLPTAPFFVAHPHYSDVSGNLPVEFPLFVKPLNTGGGKGIDDNSVVHGFAQLEQKVQTVYERYGSASLIESYLSGREFSVAILEQHDSDDLVAMPIELIADVNDRGDRILGSRVKSADTERAIAVYDMTINQMVCNLAKDVYQALGARDLGRIDIRMDVNDNPYFLEANLVPGLAEANFISYFNRACRLNENMSYEEIIFSITELGLNRCETEDQHITSQLSPVVA